jgi:hypothetical protein
MGLGTELEAVLLSPNHIVVWSSDEQMHAKTMICDPAEVFGAGANLKRRLTSLFIPLNASG